MMNPVQEVFEESQELVRLRMAQNLRPQRAFKKDPQNEKLASRRVLKSGRYARKCPFRRACAVE